MKKKHSKRDRRPNFQRRQPVQEARTNSQGQAKFEIKGGELCELVAGSGYEFPQTLEHVRAFIADYNTVLGQLDEPGVHQVQIHGGEHNNHTVTLFIRMPNQDTPEEWAKNSEIFVAELRPKLEARLQEFIEAERKLVSAAT